LPARNTLIQLLVLYTDRAEKRKKERKKAFDSVWHEGLWAVLKSWTGPKLIRILQDIYGQTRGAARVNGELTDWFNMTVGNI